MKRDPDPVNVPFDAGNGNARERPASVWSTSICPQQMEGGLSIHADIFENGVCVCQIVLSGDFESDAAVQAALTDRLSRWIDEYKQRGREAAPFQTF